MNIIANPVFLDHETGQHPENRHRLEVIPIDHYTDIVLDGAEYLPLIHSQEYIDSIREASRKAPVWLDQDTMVSAGSYQAAIDAVAASIMASETGDFALVRPPGHHAYGDHASGFCLFNNIAVAVEKLRREDKRVLILDFDGHLGDGTSHLFYDTDRVLFWSLHQFPAFPGNGRNNEIGEGKGKGFTVNVPLPPGSANDIFLHAFDVYLPIIEQFCPDVIAVSAGFDSHRFDPLLQLNLTANAYYQVGKKISDQSPSIFAVLEGGYNTAVLPDCIHNFIAGINREALPFDEGHSSSSRTIWEQYDMDLHLGIAQLRSYWKF
jgi:acetoin utilization deacetylase AcuC-like enzyme